MPFILDMYDRIKRGQMRVKDVLNISNPAENGPGMPPGVEPPSINQEAAMENLHKQVEKIRRHAKEVDKLKGILQVERKVPGVDGAPAATVPPAANAPAPLDDKTRELTVKTLDEHKKSILEAIQDMKLGRQPDRRHRRRADHAGRARVPGRARPDPV